jgi:hypothetical protein
LRQFCASVSARVAAPHAETAPESAQTTQVGSFEGAKTLDCLGERFGFVTRAHARHEWALFGEPQTGAQLVQHLDEDAMVTRLVLEDQRNEVLDRWTGTSLRLAIQIVVRTPIDHPGAEDTSWPQRHLEWPLRPLTRTT